MYRSNHAQAVAETTTSRRGFPKSGDIWKKSRVSTSISRFSFPFRSLYLVFIFRGYCSVVCAASFASRFCAEDSGFRSYDVIPWRHFEGRVGVLFARKRIYMNVSMRCVRGPGRVTTRIRAAARDESNPCVGPGFWIVDSRRFLC